MFDARYSGYVRVGGLIAVISMLAAPSWAGPQVYRGTISTGAEYDLYNIPLLAGQGVIGRLVCEELSPAQRPLDPGRQPDPAHEDEARGAARIGGDDHHRDGEAGAPGTRDGEIEIHSRSAPAAAPASAPAMMNA